MLSRTVLLTGIQLLFIIELAVISALPLKFCKTIGENCERCNKTMCTDCKSGSCGRDCKKSCRGNCSWACDIDSCNCRYCADGFYGTNCSIPCSDTCSSTCDRNTGDCKDGCKFGYCSRRCKRECNENCLNKACLFDNCNCLECENGFYGDFCQNNCTSNTCTNGCSSCEQKTGLCLKCKQTNEIPNCDYCRNAKCERRVYCTYGCKNSTYGIDCQRPCPNCSNCDQYSGKCIQSETNTSTVVTEPGVCYTMSPLMVWLYSTLCNGFVAAGAFYIYILKGRGITPCSIFREVRGKIKKDHFENVEEGLTDTDMVALTQTLEIVRAPARNDRHQTSMDGYFHIKGYNMTSVRYIASERVSTYTAGELWGKVTESGSQLIILLSRGKNSQVERLLRVDCQTDDVYVQCTKKGSKSTYLFRMFRMQKGSSEKIIHLYHFDQWVKGGSSLTRFIRLIRKDEKFKLRHPITVLSSESGNPVATFIALDYIIDSYEATRQVPHLSECVRQIVEQRRGIFSHVDQLKKLRDHFTELFPQDGTLLPYRDDETVGSKKTIIVHLLKFFIPCIVIIGLYFVVFFHIGNDYTSVCEKPMTHNISRVDS